MMCKVFKELFQMSFSFGGGKNPYQSGAKDEIFVKPKVDIDFGSIKPLKTRDDISLFDITSEEELNDTGKKFTSDEIFGDIDPEFDGPKWLGLTGKGTFGDEPKLMKTTFLQGPPKQTDKDGNPKKPENNGNYWNWNTFA